MKSKSETAVWKDFTSQELEKISELIKPLGYVLIDDQPHIQGERFLMTKEKLVLLVTRTGKDEKFILKVSNRKGGIKEIDDEKNVRDVLSQITFASDTLILPKEIYYGHHKDGYLIWIIEYIPQEKVFAAFPLQEQFFLALKIFEEQEAFNASTFEHMRAIKKVVPVANSDDYLEKFTKFEKNVSHHFPDTPTSKAMHDALAEIQKGKEMIGLYCGYLAHADLAPSNFRIHDNKVYSLDLSSMLFGNKHESWARFMNWALVHSKGLGPILTQYIETNKSDEVESLRLMRIYKAGFLLDYYTQLSQKTSGNLRELELLRLKLWTEIIKKFIDKEVVSKEFLENYVQERNQLRTPEEARRQKEFNLVEN